MNISLSLKKKFRSIKSNSVQRKKIGFGNDFVKDIATRDGLEVFHGFGAGYFGNEDNGGLVDLGWERSLFKPRCSCSKNIKTTYILKMFVKSKI